MKGWIKLHRSVMQHWLYEDADMLRIWIDILLLASHKESKMLFNGGLLGIQRGSFVVSKLQWAKRLKVSRPKLDRVLKMLESDQMIVQQTSNRKTAISVVNYDTYQQHDEASVATDVTTGDTTEQQPPSNSPAPAVQPACTFKKDNNYKNIKNEQEVCAGRLVDHELDHHFLPVEAEAAWMLNPQYTNVGRRPLKNYPDMFLAPHELADVFEQLGDAGIPADQFKLVFKRVAARLATYKAQGKNLVMISVYNWLIGWAKSDVVKELTASCNLERSKVYLAGAKI